MTILNKEKILEVARAFIDEGKYDRAIREYEKILLADPTDLRVKLRIAELYTKRKQITEAIRIYREVAEAYAAEGFYLKAVTVHKNILRLNPSLTEINEQLAFLYEKMGLIADAVRQYDILAAALDVKGQGERVIEIRERIVRLCPRDGHARVKLAELYQRESKMDEAITQYEELARQLEESDGDRARLADLYEKILAHRPERTEMLRRLIDLAVELGDTRRALEWLESDKALVERDPELLRLMAQIYASQNQNETARGKLILLADLEAEGGDADAALDAYVEILALFPDEEDRVARRVEEVKAGALPDVVERAAERRREREQEEARRLEAEEAEKEGEEKKPLPEAVPPPEEEPSSPEAEISDVTQPIPRRRTTPAPAPPKSAPIPPPPPAVPSPPPLAPSPKPRTQDRRDADDAFDLGMVYRRTGLGDEAAAEFVKAREIYAACLEAGMSDPDIPQRLAQIDAALGGESKVAAERPPSAQKRTTTSVGKPVPRPAFEEKKSPPKGKKKVSFV